MAFASPMPTRPNALGLSGCALKSSISSLSRMPVPGTITPLPKYRFTVCVVATALPCASTTDRWVVLVDSSGPTFRSRGASVLGVAAATSIPARNSPA